MEGGGGAGGHASPELPQQLQILTRVEPTATYKQRLRNGVRAALPAYCLLECAGNDEERAQLLSLSLSTNEPG